MIIDGPCWLVILVLKSQPIIGRELLPRLGRWPLCSVVFLFSSHERYLSMWLQLPSLMIYCTCPRTQWKCAENLYRHSQPLKVVSESHTCTNIRVPRGACRAMLYWKHFMSRMLKIFVRSWLRIRSMCAHPKPFFPKRKNVNAKYLKKKCIKFVLFYALQKNDV